eukprot:CAMPEP_0181134646 /NCGR_PEP_ID=MMETSP1071-20121207/32201_1 /TAXON_ID=35127 /ORGANISM="Thalassiosira sp., Strain NH16" /LENGTH=383 /DNA_ID=CAMNT_0023221183 /DNA_START=290 /DNA_END=1441 /DNA_ORIENTATION=-
MADRTRAPIKVAVSGAAGNIGYALLPLLASGRVFKERPVELRLLEIPQAIKSLEGTRMELVDCAFPCLADVVCTTDPAVAFDGADVIVLVGGFPRKKGMARKDLIRANTRIFSSMGRAIDDAASPDVRVLVVANPSNTNCLVALTEASSVPSKNFCALSFLDHQRARAQVARRLGVRAGRVRNVIVWGNHSETQYPDALTDGHCLMGEHATGGKERVSLRHLLADDLDWATNEFAKTVQERGRAVIEVRGASSALSAATAAADCLESWLVAGTKEGETVSMAVYNDKGYYGVRKGIVFSFPCECRGGEWHVKEGLELTQYTRRRLEVSQDELLEEREAARGVLLEEGSRRDSMAPSSLSLPLTTTSDSIMVESGHHSYLLSKI